MNDGMADYSVILNQFTIYVGSSFLITGLAGNLINAGVFYKNKFRNPTTFLLFLASCWNFMYITVGLLTRVLAAGLNVDVASNNRVWCKIRIYLIQLCALISISCICYATIDQFFVSSQHERLRRLSKISTTGTVICILIVYWILYSIPILFFSDFVQLGDGRIVCSFTNNRHFIKFAAYFNLPIIWSIAPITVLITFGTLTYRNISLLKNVRNRERAQRYLTSMLLLYIIFIVIGTLPYAFFYVYSAITLNTVKSADRQALEKFLSNIVAVILYFSNSCSFFVYYTASATYRQQVKQFLHLSKGAPRGEFESSVSLKRETLSIG
jgi:hypothetical protein